jgi:nitrate reductase cytochrome c-type subunit
MGRRKEAMRGWEGFGIGEEPCNKCSVYILEVDESRAEHMSITHYHRCNDVCGDEMSNRRTFPAFKLHRPSSEL